MENPPTKHSPEIISAIRFICIYEENHGLIFTILWEMVVSTNVNMKINAAKLLKAIVPYIDAKVASTHVLPALITLGSDQNLNVKYASIDAFGAVAQHLKMTWYMLFLFLLGFYKDSDVNAFHIHDQMRYLSDC
ncbi:hypothetical protein S83_013662 [Arachis hypogaea]